MSETVIIHRPGSSTGVPDEQGNMILNATTDIPVVAIAVAPLQGDEIQDDGSRSTNGYTVFLPFGTDIRSTDTMTVRGVDGWQVEGDAGQADWVSPFTGWAPGTVAVVRRAS